MADGDIFRKLGRVYQKSYKWLREGKASTTECARTVMEALKKDLKVKGNLPVVLAQQMGEKLTQILSGFTGNASIDWGFVNKEIEKIAQVDGQHDLKELILRSVKSFIHELRHSDCKEINTNSATEAILGLYFNEVYESGFKERIPLIDKHYAGTDVITLEGRIKEIQPEINSLIPAWAKKACIDGSVANLRLPSRHQVATVDMEEDLC